MLAATPLHELVDRVHALERRTAVGVSSAPAVKTGWALDEAIGGLGRGMIHEWFGPEGATRRDANWMPPMGVLLHVARRALAGAAAGRGMVCVGRRCWTPESGPAVLIDPPSEAARVWAADLALRCPAVGVVILDGSGLTMPTTRRLQLAAAQAGVLGLVARPRHELAELSAAATRWSVAPALTDQDGPRWAVELLRCKGMQPASHVDRRWMVELSC